MKSDAVTFMCRLQGLVTVHCASHTAPPSLSPPLLHLVRRRLSGFDANMVASRGICAKCTSIKGFPPNCYLPSDSEGGLGPTWSLQERGEPSEGILHPTQRKIFTCVPRADRVHFKPTTWNKTHARRPVSNGGDVIDGAVAVSSSSQSKRRGPAGRHLRPLGPHIPRTRSPPFRLQVPLARLLLRLRKP